MRVLSLPTIKTFRLETDPDKVAEVDIRQATFGDNRQNDELFKTVRTLYNARGQAIGTEQEINEREVITKRIFLTLAAAGNITNEDGDELFSFTGQRVSNESEFRKQVDKLPDDMVAEIYRDVCEVNPQWKTAGK